MNEYDVIKAYELAEKYHEGQKYGEEPYLNHVVRIANNFDDDLHIVVALLHDTVEDTKLSLCEINKIFGSEVSYPVDCLTRRNNEKYLEEYIPRIKSCSIATDVKTADLLNNIQHCTGDVGRISLLIKYQKAFSILNIGE